MRSDSRDIASLQIAQLLEPVQAFLLCPTPQCWLQEAAKPENLQVLLVDHCNCELKAAQTAIVMMRRYALSEESIKAVNRWTKPYEDYVYCLRGDGQFPDKKEALNIELKPKDDTEFARDVVRKMVALIKEELMHFEQVLTVMRQHKIDYIRLTASRYAAGLVKQVRTYEPAALMDKLIIGAMIEARSCERFALLAPHLEPSIGVFYQRLLKSEARHFQDYLLLARQVAKQDEKLAGTFDERVQQLLEQEAELIGSNDSEFRFHSGLPDFS